MKLKLNFKLEVTGAEVCAYIKMLASMLLAVLFVYTGQEYNLFINLVSYIVMQSGV